jgi:hypothetical protein
MKKYSQNHEEHEEMKTLKSTRARKQVLKNLIFRAVDRFKSNKMQVLCVHPKAENVNLNK